MLPRPSSRTNRPAPEIYFCAGGFCAVSCGEPAVELAPGVSEAMVRFAVRHEYARCVEDVLARRSRLLFLDARLAKSLAPRVGVIVSEETGLDAGTEAFCDLADSYLRLPD